MLSEQHDLIELSPQRTCNYTESLSKHPQSPSVDGTMLSTSDDAIIDVSGQLTSSSHNNYASIQQQPDIVIGTANAHQTDGCYEQIVEDVAGGGGGESEPLIRSDDERRPSGREKQRKRNRRQPARRQRQLVPESTADDVTDAAPTSMTLNWFPDDQKFTALVNAVEKAIDIGIQPERIYQGSSGSYFVRDVHNDIVGVFKPKDEEPYGKQNPKWQKYIQKTLCPCCFGRSCLVLNQGYLSEAGASFIDRQLGLDVVPPTRVVRLVSKAFNYSHIDRATSRAKHNINDHFPEVGRHFHRLGLPPKTGSLQQFVRGYKDADHYLKQWADNPDAGPQGDQAVRFQCLFEKLVVLDYIIRNTDRGNDNWLIKFVAPLKRDEESNVPLIEMNEQSVIDGNDATLSGQISVAAIDNGLAFPQKHPDEWRTYPYHWHWLKYAQRPFSDATKVKVMHLISDWGFVDTLTNGLHQLFSLDKDFEQVKFERQMAVLRGQIVNLCQALKENRSPAELVQMPPMLVERREAKPKLHRGPGMARSRRSKPKGKVRGKSLNSNDPDVGEDALDGLERSRGTSVSSNTDNELSQSEPHFAQSIVTRFPFFTWC